MNNILITGANGQLGSEIRELSKKENTTHFFFTDSEELNIINYNDVEVFIIENNIDSIINCAAYTAVDNAEKDINICDKVNHLAVINLAKISKQKNIKLIHISTDYVFDGCNHRPYLETDTTNPQSVYGKTKLDGELAMLAINPKNSIIIRTSWVYSSYGNNFVKTMLRLGKERSELGIIFDQIGTPTYARDLAKVIFDISPKIKNDKTEIYHFSNEGVCSWFDFAKAIFEIEKYTIKVNAIETKQYPTPAKRPFYSVLNKTKIKEHFQIDVPYWESSLKDCLLKINP